MRAHLDTNVIVRHLVGDPPDQAARSTALLRAADRLVVADLIVAEACDVLERVYRAPREQVARSLRSLLAMRSVVVADVGRLLRALEVYELQRLDFAEAYLVAVAEQQGPAAIASFDRAIDRVATVARVEP